MVGITSINGFPLSMNKRFEYISKAGFTSVLLWWGDGEIEDHKLSYFS